MANIVGLKKSEITSIVVSGDLQNSDGVINLTIIGNAAEDFPDRLFYNIDGILVYCKVTFANGDTINTMVQPKELAKTAFERAKQTGQTAVLASSGSSYSSEKTIELNLKKGEFTIKLEFIMKLVFDPENNVVISIPGLSFHDVHNVQNVQNAIAAENANPNANALNAWRDGIAQEMWDAYVLYVGDSSFWQEYRGNCCQ
jgi:hypothetical protein